MKIVDEFLSEMPLEMVYAPKATDISKLPEIRDEADIKN